jgi:hypothetical protein
MYYTERDPFSGKKIYVAKTFRERKMQRAFIQYSKPANKELIIEALKSLNMLHVFKKFQSSISARQYKFLKKKARWDA